jgi:SAM-dependent methyltransferase
VSLADQLDAYADVYDLWVETAPITQRNLPFYVEEMAAADGPVVELGVGNGRITVAAAEAGARVTGVDLSPAMLERCRRRAEAAGVADRVRLLEADWRSFELDAPAALAAIPFHSLGHLVTPEARRACLAHVRERLRPGGRLVFDHFVFDPAKARAGNGVLRLRARREDPATGGALLLWAASLYDEASHRIDVHVATDAVDAKGRVAERRVFELPFSWSDPDEIRALLAETGYEVEACYGDYDRTPFGPSSREQVWVAQRG